MNTYTVSKLTKVSECEMALEDLGQEKNNLQVRKSVIELDLTNKENRSTSVLTEMQSVDSRIAQLDTEMAGFTVGSDKYLVAEKERYDLLSRKSHLQLMIANSGSYSFIDRERDHTLINFKLSDVDDVIAQITTRKTELESSAPSA